MESLYIFLLIGLSGVFAMYPDMRKDFNFSNFLMFLVYSFTEITDDNDSNPREDGLTVSKVVPYETKYLDKFRSMGDVDVDVDVDVDEESLKYTTVVEYTPYGNVAMRYDSKKETFVYYSDHTIPYRFLEVVAQKFAIHMNCKKLVVDTEKEIETLKQETLEKKEALEKVQATEQTERKESTVPEKKDVFAKFKSYNKTSSIPGGSSNNRDASSSTKSKDPDPDPTLLEKSNTYSHEGKFSNMEILQIVKKDAFDKRLKMSYADFKKMSTATNKNLA